MTVSYSQIPACSCFQEVPSPDASSPSPPAVDASSAAAAAASPAPQKNQEFRRQAVQDLLRKEKDFVQELIR